MTIYPPNSLTNKQISFQCIIDEATKSLILEMVSFYCKQMAALASLCFNDEADFRPNMTIIVKALQPLLEAQPGPADEALSSEFVNLSVI